MQNNSAMTPADIETSHNRTGSQSMSQLSAIFDTKQLLKMYDNGMHCIKTTQPADTKVPVVRYKSVQSNSIEDILGRPIKLATYIVNNATTFIGSHDMGDYNANPMASDKLTNFQYIRGDACYKFVVNAGVQTLGRVMVLSSPYENQLPLSRNIVPTTTLTQLTTYPHAEIDVGSGETLTYKIPYIAKAPLSLIGAMGWSFIYLRMLNSFVGLTAAETFELTVYAWWESVSLFMPIAQGPEDEEAIQKTAHPISSAFSELSSFSDQYSWTPIIGPYAAGVGWFTGLIARAASAFGYSKPLNDSSTTFVSPHPARGYTNAEGCDDSLSLSLRPSNRVSVHPSNFGVSKDPHSFRSFLSRDHILLITTWSTSQPTNTKLVNQVLGPTSMLPTLYAVISEQFQQQAVSLIFRLSLVKNAFYSGRLAIQWSADGTNPFAWNASLPGIILDVKTNDELVFRVPYMSSTRLRDISQTNGRLLIWVLNPLRVNDTYPQSIAVNLSVAVDDNVLFAMPRSSTRVLAQGLPDDECVIARPAALATKAVDIYSVPPPDPNDLLVIGGEYTNTISDLLKRFCYYFEYFNFDEFYFTPSDTTNHLTSYHPYQFFSNYYRFWRGSFRIKLVMVQPPTTTAGVVDYAALLKAKIFYGSTSYPPTVGVAVPISENRLPESFVRSSINNVLEISVPYYSIYDRSVVGAPDTTPTPSIQVYVVPSDPVFVNSAQVAVYMAVGEDFSFGFPCGMPKMT